MAHKHRLGNQDQITLAVTLDSDSLPAYAIHAGDLMAKDASLGLVPVASFTWDTDKATTQAAFVAAFRGMAVGESRLASKDKRDLEIPVVQDGDVDFDCASATYVVGDYLGPKKGSGNNLINTLEKVSDKAHAIAVCVKDSGASATVVRGRLINTVVKK